MNEIIKYKSEIKFLGMFICISLVTCMLIGKFEVIVPYYMAIFISCSMSIYSYLFSKLCLDIHKNNVYKDIAMVLGYLGVINLLFSIYRISSFVIYKKDFVNSCLFQMVYLLICCSLFYILIINNKKLNIKSSIYVLNVFILGIVMITLYTKVPQLLLKYGYINILNAIIPIFCIILYIKNYLHLPKLKKKLRAETIIDLRVIIQVNTIKCLCFLFYNLTINYSFSNAIMYVLTIINYIEAYKIMCLLVRDIIKKPNENLYSKYQIEKNKLNTYISKLKNKNLEIIRWKNWFYNSIMSMPEGIIICENKKITFVNNKALSYLKLENMDSLIDVNYEDIVKSRSNSNEIEGLSINNIKIEFQNNIFIGEELNLQSLEDSTALNMIILNDIKKELQLKELKDELDYKNQVELSRNELLSNLSHEFKTPVNIIYSTAQLQEINFKNHDYTKEIEYNNLIKKNCNRLIRLVNNFIDSTKFESNIFNTDLKLVNIVTLVEDLTESVVNFAKNKNISIVFDTEEEEIFSLVDIDYMERIILNILSNAIKYNNIDGKILVYLSLENDKVNISIKDNGVGIEKNKLEKLFVRFERFDNNTLSHQEGTGIGLNIVKQMVDALAGEIKAESEVNVGTTITIILPVSRNKNLSKYENYGDLTRKVELELSDI